MNKMKNKITYVGIEPQFYEKLYPILTQVFCQPHSIQTPQN
jgi:hypothetical protein